MSATIAIALLFASHPNAELPEPRATELMGKVREVGGGVGGRPKAVLIADDGKELTLYGQDDGADDELRRLSGVRIKVRGLMDHPRVPHGPHVLVETYEIVDVGGGVVPSLGQLASIELDNGPRLLFVEDGGRAHLLPQGWGKKMRRHVGARLWMVGSMRKGQFAPERFAILRAAPTPGAAQTKSDPKP